MIFDYYLDTKLQEIEESFRLVGKKFIVVNNQSISDTEFKLLQYYFPLIESSTYDYNKSQALLDYFNYTGDLQSGIIYYGAEQLNLVALPSFIVFNKLDEFFKEFYKNIEYENLQERGFLYSPTIYYPDEIEFDDENKEAIQFLIDELNDIKNKGNFIALLPLLEKHLQVQKKKNNTKISRLYNDQDYKIWLVDYNLEIKLSQLTKSIYLLFLALENDINLTDLYKYEKSLTTIYFSVSYQENLDKMRQSIQLLIADKNAIYVHLSRIKSAFHKLVHKDIAHNYCIQGAKEQPKEIIERIIELEDEINFVGHRIEDLISEIDKID